MVTRWDARILAISTVRVRQSPECNNFVRQRRIPSSTLSRTISICRRSRRRLQRGSQQAKAKRAKGSRCCAARRMPKIFWANIPFPPERLFRSANNLAVCCSKRANQKKHNGNLKLGLKSIRDVSEVYMEGGRRQKKMATRKTKAAITRSWPRKRQ